MTSAAAKQHSSCRDILELVFQLSLVTAFEAEHLHSENNWGHDQAAKCICKSNLE